MTFEELKQASEGASQDAIANLLQKGIPIFYQENNMDILEQPDGQRFQIEYTQLKRGAYRIVQELSM